MRIALLAAIMFFVFGAVVDASSDWKIVSDEEGNYSVVPTDQRIRIAFGETNFSEEISFDELLDTLESLRGKRIESLKISARQFFLTNESLQRELFDQFRKDHPRLLEVALASTGNMHNPKVIPLSQKFSETILKAPTIQTIDEKLRTLGFTLKDVDAEKFSLVKKTDPVTFFGFVWLEIEPLTTETEESE